ncbi:hypothetical protein LOD99_7565 [Oopsacas minuta]|uniref:BtpA n=1 Tax=Oopsacas minuta TaxID=111878 RepID=A0AAV7JPX3_9METZ|nr:hypothetical protein LOD99_7565 [Oopsacas minuta]
MLPKKLCNIIAMIHTLPLPGSPLYRRSLDKIISQASKEAEIYCKHGVDCLMVENMHDRPYLHTKVSPETVSAMTRICLAIKSRIGSAIPMGIQVLSAANKEALAIAKCCELQFIRAEGFVYSHVADEGWTDSCAASLLRYRQVIGAENIQIYTDIKKKHASHAVTHDLDIVEVAKGAEFFLSDGLILTGISTGQPASVEEFEKLRAYSNLPIFIGSGVNQVNISLFEKATGLIVGSHFKKDGVWYNEVDEGRVREFMKIAKTLD